MSNETTSTSLDLSQFKICTKCYKSKMLSHFYKNRKSFSARCKDCMTSLAKIRYRKSSNRRVKVVLSNSKRRIKNALIVNQYKLNKPCKDCGKLYDSYCMDFDHLSNKIEAVSLMIHNSYSISGIMNEINKCELVCVLCHRLRTHLRQPHRNYTKVQIRNKNYIGNAKNKPCEVCKIQRLPCQMEFDHIDRITKLGNVSTMATQKLSISKIQKEIDKCRILCSLCHRQHTARISNWKITKSGD